MFLRAFRYCDSIFLEEEERRIYADFGKLGYSRRFIEKAKISARRDREHEIQVKPWLHYRLYSPFQASPFPFCHFNETVDVYGEQRRPFKSDMTRCTAVDATGMATNGPNAKYSRGVLFGATAAVALGCQMATAKLEICFAA